MPGVVKVKVMSARDLPIMDRSSELTDAFVEVCVCVCKQHEEPRSFRLQLRLGENYQRTKVCPKTLNPVWDSPWFIFTVRTQTSEIACTPPPPPLVRRGPATPALSHCTRTHTHKVSDEDLQDEPLQIK